MDLTRLPATFDDLKVLQIGVNTHILHPGGRIVLNNFTSTDLTPEDFLTLRLGTEGNDNLTVTTGPVLIQGLGGDDLLRAFNGVATLEGGTGNDAYFVYEDNTVIIEQADEGIDRVYTAIDHTLADNIEFGNVQGTGAVNITGNELDNNLRGNEASNELIGGAGTDFIRGQGGDDTVNGGTGVDILSGGAGADTFEFSANGDLDLVIDFEDGIDTLFIDPVGLAFEDITIIDFIEDTLVDYGSGRFIVEGVTASQLTEEDFGFTFFFPPLE